MTKNEFIQKAVISMTGKVIGNNGFSDPHDWGNTVTEAGDLANIMESKGYEFETEDLDSKESMKTVLKEISSALQDISDALQAPGGTPGSLSTLQEIALTLHERFSPVE